MKRYTHLPQLVLGAAFSWGIPMAFAAQLGELPPALWLLYLGNLLWTVAYDTKYAMVDRDDDIQAGIKSTAILFGEHDRLIIGVLQLLCLLTLYLAGQAFSLGPYYRLSLVVAAVLFGYHQYLIRERRRDACFKAFLHNNWVGMVIFLGIALHYSATGA
jgi:4-hydroxybenzoate polyprenyltransferase